MGKLYITVESGFISGIYSDRKLNEIEIVDYDLIKEGDDEERKEMLQLSDQLKYDVEFGIVNQIY